MCSHKTGEEYDLLGFHYFFSGGGGLERTPLVLCVNGIAEKKNIPQISINPR